MRWRHGQQHWQQLLQLTSGEFPRVESTQNAQRVTRQELENQPPRASKLQQNQHPYPPSYKARNFGVDLSLDLAPCSSDSLGAALDCLALAAAFSEMTAAVAAAVDPMRLTNI